MSARVLIGLAIVAAARIAAADAPPVVAIAGDAGTCPTASDVAAALTAIFPNLETATPDDPAALHVELSPQGEGFHVRAGDVERDFTGGDCAERARKAAVFVALVLAPPTVEVPPDPVAAPSAAPGETSARAAVALPPVGPAAPSGPPWLQLDVAAAIETAPRDANNLVAGGGELGVFIGGARVGAIATLSGLAPTDMQVGTTGAQLTRTPAAFGIRGRARSGRVGFAADAALTTALLTVRGLDPSYGAQSERFELGARVGARIEVWPWSRIAVFAAARLDIVPDTYELALPGAGMVGATPGWWIGGVIGVTAGFQ
ncbi:MAG TPA: hypothetical protein VGL61_01755 [Kofleriaceae bacterium]